MSVRGKILSGVLMVSFLAGSAVAFAEPGRRVPAGHSYSPTSQRLPALNSPQDKINSRADIYETEIYRANRDAAITFSNMRIFGRDRLLRGGSSNRPRY